jgi:nicotinate-nucleotide adenylyltransferase
VPEHIGILGGTFDPIHFGHLRTALELAETLDLQRILLIPGGTPPHRGAPVASAQQRLTMVELSVQQSERLHADGRECRKSSASYTVETLLELRREWGDQVRLSLCVGADAFAGMHTWHRWQELPELAHIVVVARPGWHLPEDLGELEIWRDRFVYQDDTLAYSTAGKVLFLSLTPMAVSATHIRQLIGEGHSARYLLPDSVWHYIQQHRLYQAATQDAKP